MPHPGKLRERDLEIVGSRHEPPACQEVPALVAEMLDYINNCDLRKDPASVAAHALCINWVHPFEDGNGRTARAVAYLLLYVGFGTELPGNPTLLERLAGKKFDYLDGLAEADRAAREGRPSVAALDALIRQLLKDQLAAAGWIW